MTREEAIEILQELWRYKETDKYTEAEIRQALNMAIKALEQEPIYYPPCQDCHTKMNEIRRAYDNVKSLDDAVSRQALLEFFKDDDYVVNEINNMPSVLPKREQGEHDFLTFLMETINPNEMEKYMQMYKSNGETQDSEVKA